MSVAALFISIACRLSTNRCLNRGINIPGSKTIVPGGETVDVNANGRLTHRTEYRKISDAGYSLHNCFDPLGGLCERLKIAAKKLDRVLALDPGNRFLNVVLDVLREVEFDAGKFSISVDDSSLVNASLSTPFRQRLSGFSGTKNSALKNPVASVPSSGRPCCDMTVSTSGKFLITLRISLTYPLPSSSDTDDGIVARIQRLPSSRWGKNSRPSERPAKIASASNNAVALNVTALLVSANSRTGV